MSERESERAKVVQPTNKIEYSGSSLTSAESGLVTFEKETKKFRELVEAPSNLQ